MARPTTGLSAGTCHCWRLSFDTGVTRPASELAQTQVLVGLIFFDGPAVAHLRGRLLGACWGGHENQRQRYLVVGEPGSVVAVPESRLGPLIQTDALECTDPVSGAARPDGDTRILVLTDLTNGRLVDDVTAIDWTRFEEYQEPIGASHNCLPGPDLAFLD